MAMTRTAQGGWFRVHHPRPAATTRLICFPHAGGSASAFWDWPRFLPDSVELVAVQYPGRQDRHGEPLPADLTTLAEQITRDVTGWLDRPTAFFGHSMGATVAFEVARRLEPRYPSPLGRLFVSARRPPSTPSPVKLEFGSDEQVMSYIRDLGGAGAALLEDEDLRELTLPMLRADFQLVERYRYTPGAPVTCPITAIGGDADPSFTEADAPGWKAHTTAGFDAQVLPGGHFYTETAAPQLVHLLAERLGALVPRQRGA
jgi:surfactin synthase thioesterase subunit